MIHVGIDEAGYGPTFGPLVVSAAAFEVSDRLAAASEVFEAPPPPPLPGRAADSQRQRATSPSGPVDPVDPAPVCSVDLWELLGRAVVRKPDRKRIPVNDSKKLYRPGKGLGHLEEGLLPFLFLRDGTVPNTLRALLRTLERVPSADQYLDEYPWYTGCDLELPTATFAAYVRKLASRLERELAKSEVRFLGLACRPIEVSQFNRTLAERGNKALVPFEAIGSFLARLWKTYPGQPIEAVVDRQGGRIQYAPLLFRVLQPRGVRIDVETAERSVYCLRGDRQRGPLRVTFTRQGDAKSFSVALASMMSKYVRELHMSLFNRYWTSHQDGLAPTAGYPTDARRFLEQTVELRRRLGVSDGLLVRRR